jgi:hypothetical protein
MSPVTTSKSAYFQFGSNKLHNFVLSKHFIFLQTAIWFVALRSRVGGYTRFDECYCLSSELK